MKNKILLSVVFLLLLSIALRYLFLKGRSGLSHDILRDPINKVVVITGTSSGLGESLAKTAFRYGMKLVLVDINFLQSKKLADLFNASGGQAVAIEADLSKPLDRKKVIDETLKHFGRIDVLINNAGYVYASGVDSLHFSQAYHSFDVNFWAYVDLTYMVLPIMERQNSGLIVAISSIYGLEGYFSRGISMYIAAKRALVGFYGALLLEMRNQNKNIDVKVVCPATLKTNVIRNMVMLDKEGYREEAVELRIRLQNRNEKFGEQPDKIAEEIFTKLKQKQMVILPGRAKLIYNDRMKKISESGLFDNLIGYQ